LLEKHGALEAARQDALGYAAKGRAALQAMPEHPLREMLESLAEFVVSRIS